ncbi:hypothetical protein F5Y17DRAFT_217532 [Xylariaceae sp. FL0594]|nr:hypothetical protein F5Y17DRAFT_217532 [Xylariaceae sp. FL0594]
MDAASTAINKMFHGGKSSSKEDQGAQGTAGASASSASASTTNTKSRTGEAPTLDQRTAPAVEHETVRKQHEQVEQTLIDRERHQDHYKTTVQPLQDREVMPEEHMYEQGETQRRTFQHDRDQEARLAHERKQAQFHDVSREAAGGVERKTTRQPAQASEHVHHHLHETIQPVIEKETVMPSVTHKTNKVKEVHQERGVDEGISVNQPISKEEFQGRLRRPQEGTGGF